MRAALSLSVVTTALALSSSWAAAGGFSIAEQSISAAGTAGAGTAREGDPGLAWYNPAALADGQGLRFGAGLIAALPSLEVRSADGNESSERKASPIPSLHASWARGSWAAGISLGVPFGAGIVWPEDWQGRHEITSSRLMVGRAAPFVAWRKGRVRLAAGPHLDVAEMRLARTLDFVDAEGDVDLALRGVGVGAHVAAFVRAYDGPGDRIDVGVSYKSRSTIQLDGEADFESPDAFSMKTVDQGVSSELALPDRIATGVAWQRGRLTVLADLELTTWSVRREVVIDFEEEQTPDVVQTTEWNSTIAARLGAEWRQGSYVARAGLYRDPSPAPEDRLSPSSPDSTRTALSAGLGKALDRHLSLDAFYSFMHLARRQSTNPDSMAASYGGEAHMLGIGLRYLR